MRSACFIPIKANSERVPGKNTRILNGKKLYEYIISNVIEAGVFDDIYVDTNIDEVKSFAQSLGVKIINRIPELATSAANGNDLLVYHCSLHPEYDYYFQAFATAPFLQVDTIRKCFNELVFSEQYDSCFTATAHHGFYWLSGNPVNYRPGILPRSQDMIPIIEETTGLYGISKDSLIKYRCRIGKKPYICEINKYESVDINTEDDLRIAEFIGKIIYGY